MAIVVKEQDKQQEGTKELWVWGCNKMDQIDIGEDLDQKVTEPKRVKLEYAKEEYQPYEVACGKNFTAVIGTYPCEDVDSKNTEMLEDFLN